MQVGDHRTVQVDLEVWLKLPARVMGEELRRGDEPAASSTCDIVSRSDPLLMLRR
jgi:hypothetical protein